MKQKALIIGSSGFLGKHMYRLLQEKELEICLCNIEPHKGATDKEYKLEELETIPQDIELVFLLAAHIPYGDMLSFSRELVHANILLPARVTTYFKDSRIIYSSSISVYGDPIRLPITVDTPYNNPTAYGLSKLAAESIVKAHSNYAILRFSSLYGSGMNVSTFLPRIIQSALSRKKITIFGDGLRKQNYLHVDDAVKMLWLVSQQQENLLELGVANHERSNNEVAELVASKTGAEIVLTGNDATPYFEYSSHASFFIDNGLGNTKLEDKIDNLIDYVKSTL